MTVQAYFMGAIVTGALVYGIQLLLGLTGKLSEASRQKAPVVLLGTMVLWPLVVIVMTAALLAALLEDRS